MLPALAGGKQEKEIHMDEKKISEILQAAGADSNLDIKAAIQIAKIISHAPEERLPMIIDVFDQAGVHVSGMETIEALKEAARTMNQIGDIEALLQSVISSAVHANGEYRIRVEAFDAICAEQGQKVLNVRRTLAEMGIIRINTTGKQNFSVPVYSPETKKIARYRIQKRKGSDLMPMNNNYQPGKGFGFLFEMGC